MGADEEGADSCRHCGAVVTDEQGVWLEVQRSVPGEDDWTDYDGGSFCSQEHAAAWLAQPLPPPERPTVEESPRRRLAEVASWTLGVLVAVYAVGLMLVGSWTIVRWFLA